VDVAAAHIGGGIAAPAVRRLLMRQSSISALQSLRAGLGDLEAHLSTDLVVGTGAGLIMTMTTTSVVQEADLALRSALRKDQEAREVPVAQAALMEEVSFAS
jgi:hypothetical protein